MILIKEMKKVTKVLSYDMEAYKRILKKTGKIIDNCKQNKTNYIK